MRNQGFLYHDRITLRDGGRTALDFFSRRYRHSTEEEWRSRFRNGTIRREGIALNEDDLIDAGDELEYYREPWEEPDVPTHTETLYDDSDLVVFNKPSGLPVLPGGGFLENTLLHIVRKRANETLAPLHRLGRGTSGAILFTKQIDSSRILSKAMRMHAIGKTYLAIASGLPNEDEFSITAPIGCVPHSLLGSVYAFHPEGKASESHCHVLRREGRRKISLLAIRIGTGRPHQIRIHLACAGYPLLGDPLYGKGGLPKSFSREVQRAALPGDGGYLLHSWKLSFQHPNGNHLLDITANVVGVNPPMHELLQCFDDADEFINEADQRSLTKASHNVEP